MFLKDNEMDALNKVGLTLRNGKISVDETQDRSSLVYCGFNIYASPNGDLFEKQADSSLTLKDSEESRAEQRFIRKHRS